MPVPAPSSTYVSYNGWVFYPPRLRWSWDIMPVQNESKTYTIGTQYVLTLRAIVTNDPLGVSGGTSASDTPGDNLDDMVYALEKPGGALSIRGLGWDTDINVGGNSNDLLFGPWTQTLTVSPIGGTLTVEVLWKITWTVGCTQLVDGVDYIDAYMEGVTKVDEYGLTTRTISGMIKSYSRFNAGSVTGDAESLWDNVIVAVPPGFRRIDRSWKVDSSQNTCRYSFTDRELPSVLAPVPGTIHTTFSHTCSASGIDQSVGVTPLNTFSATATMPKGGNPWDAFNHIISIIETRLQRARAAGYSVWITGFSVTENDIFSHRSFSLNVTYLMQKGQEGSIPFEIIPDMGFFNIGELSGEYGWSNGEWASNMDGYRVWDNRGSADLRTDYPKLIFGSCSERSGAVTADQIGEPISQSLESSLNAILGGCPDEENSYFYIDTRWSTRSSAGGVVARTNRPENSGAALDDNDGRETISAPSTNTPNGPLQPPYSPDASDQVNYGSTSPLTQAWFSGVVIRIGYPPDLPQNDFLLIQAHNQGQASEFDRNVDIYQFDKFGCTIYTMVFEIGYNIHPAYLNKLLNDPVADGEIPF